MTSDAAVIMKRALGLCIVEGKRFKNIILENEYENTTFVNITMKMFMVYHFYLIYQGINMRVHQGIYEYIFRFSCYLHDIQ